MMAIFCVQPSYTHVQSMGHKGHGTHDGPHPFGHDETIPVQQGVQDAIHAPTKVLVAVVALNKELSDELHLEHHGREDVLD